VARNEKKFLFCSPPRKKITELLLRSYVGRLMPNGFSITITGMHNILKSALMAVVFLVASPVWGSGDEPDRISQRWASSFAGQEWQVKPKPAETSVYQASLTPTGDASPIAPANVPDLKLDTDRPRTQGVLASTTWLKGAFSTETEVAANQGGSTEDDPSTRMMRLGVTGSTEFVRYGLTYRKAGQAFYQESDQDLREAWGEWRNGAIAIRSTVGQLGNNVEDDPARARVERRYNRLGLTWNKPGWPHFVLTYAENAVNSALNHVGVAPQNANSHTVEAAFGYGGAAWDARLASSYGLETDLLRREAESHVQTQTVTASFRPVNALTIAPAFGYRAEQQEWSGARIDSPSASLAMNYQQSPRLRISAMGNYSGMRSSDRLIDLDTIGGKGILTWELEPVRDWTPLLSLEGGYNLQVNRLIPSAQTEDLSGLLRLVLATL
jgi:hypothetical protein